jgi:23S rRNA pseudouridine1911/1915/1917 synthase
VLGRWPELAGVGGAERPGIVHRLDKDTSGLIIVAKNEGAHLSLSRQLKQRRVEKSYLALVHGRLEPEEAVIEAPVGRHPRYRQRMAVVEGGREARTSYRVLRYLEGYSLVEVTPATGRTHQIRVHLAALGHPVVGDAVYGRRSPLFPRQFLHALRLTFRHPRTGERLRLEAPLPDDLREALERAAAR